MIPPLQISMQQDVAIVVLQEAQVSDTAIWEVQQQLCAMMRQWQKPPMIRKLILNCSQAGQLSDHAIGRFLHIGVIAKLLKVRISLRGLPAETVSRLLGVGLSDYFDIATASD